MCIQACTGQCVSQHALGRGVSAGEECLPGEGGLPGGVCQGVSAQVGRYPSMYLGSHPHVDRMTDRCKNITFANYVCGR